MRVPKKYIEDFKKVFLQSFEEKGIDFNTVIDRYETGSFNNSDRVKDLNIRFKYDMFWVVNRWSDNLFLEEHPTRQNKKSTQTILNCMSALLRGRCQTALY
jgi:hypothetical protein